MADMNDQVKQLMESVGAFSELLFMHYKSLKAVGFNDSQALYLCGKVVEGMLSKGGGD